MNIREYKRIYDNSIKHFLKREPTLEISKLVKIVSEKIILDKYNYLLSKGYGDKKAIELLLKLPDILILSNENLDKELCTVYNSKTLYAVLLLHEDSYLWCYYDHKKHEFNNSKYLHFNYNHRTIFEDSIIRTVIDSTYRDDISKYALINKDDNLETRLVKLKKLKVNSNGYHIK